MARERATDPPVASPWPEESRRRERAYWRRHLVLCGIATAVVLVPVALLAAAAPGGTPPVSELRLAPDGRVEIGRPAEEALRTLVWPAAAAAAAVAGVLGALVLHTIRVAAFTFRRGGR